MNADLRQRLVAFYLRYPGAVTIALAALAFAVLWNDALFRGAIVPYDFQTADYPSYVDAVRAAKFSIFCLYNPFNDAGQVTPNLFAFFDPPAWIAAAAPLLPGFAALQLEYLLHLLLIPVGLVLVAWANDVPHRRWIAIVPISLVAYAMGPTLKYMQQTNAIATFGYMVLLFGALEVFRRTGALWAAIVAGLCAAYTVQGWIYATIFLPLPLAAYAVAHWRELLGSRKRLGAAGFSIAIAILIVLPSVLLDLKIDHSIEVARNLEQLSEILPVEAVAMLGAPEFSVPLVGIPAALVLLVVLGLRYATRVERLAYGVVILVLVLYGFADLTPFGPFFRHLYPIAGLIRRPYATWYVLIPFLLFLAVRALRELRPEVLRLASVVPAVALAVGLAQGTTPLGVRAGLIALTMGVVVWRPKLLIVMSALVIQWALIDWMPFERSQWRPQPLAAASAYFAPYESIRAILPFEATRSAKAYRVANIGLPAEFGPFAGAFRVYNVAGTYNTLIPHELVLELGTDQLHATKIPAYFAEHPDALGSERWRRMAVRYYIFAPAAFAALPPRALERPGTRVVPSEGYWKVVEDDRADPFVSALLDSGARVPLDAQMSRDTFRIAVPAGARTIRIAQHYDNWWHAYDANGNDISSVVVDDTGQLAVAAASLGGSVVTLKFTNRSAVVTIAVSIVVQLGALSLGLIFAIRALARRRAAAEAANGSEVLAPPVSI